MLKIGGRYSRRGARACAEAEPPTVGVSPVLPGESWVIPSGDGRGRKRARRRARLKYYLVSVIVIVAASAAAAQDKAPAGAAAANPPAAERALTAAIGRLLDATPAHLLDNEPLDLALLRRFYAARENRPAWSGSEEAHARAELATAALAAAADDGLNAADYHLAALAAGPAAADAAAAAAARELTLSDGFLRYAHDIRVGRVAPDEVFDDVRLPKAVFDAAAALKSALEKNRLAALIADLPPPHADYARLKDALKRYRAIAAAGGWPEVPAGQELVLDSDDPRLAILRKRLAVEDKELPRAPAEATKGDLAAALGRFQARNGLAVDGRIGPRTFAMLNVSAAERVDQIIANMERWRWMPRRFEERYVIVNTADGELKVVDHGEPILASKVVVGDNRHQSPILRATAVSVTVNPPWRVPYSIAEKEILPRLKRDPRYLEHENIVILNGEEGDPYGRQVDWKRVSATRFPYVLEQLPGPTNSLGGLKIEMPNPFDVYLHDTPLKRLFARAQRNFSHGCIRVERVAALASLLLTGDPKEAIPDLEAKIAEGETLHLDAKKALAVYVVDWTAIETPEGVVEFRDDAYGRDSRITRALAEHSRLVSLAKVPAAPAPVTASAKPRG